MTEKQGTLAGMKPKRIATLEAACDLLIGAKDEAKKAREEVDHAADAVASALKAAGEETYGFKRDGILYIVTLHDKKTVTVQRKKTKKDD